MTSKQLKDQLFAVHILIAAAAVSFLLSLVVGIICDSVTLLLDASTGLIILISAIVVRLIIEKIHKPPDHLFHFGYHKYEPFTVVMQNIAIIAVCLVSVKFAIQDIIHPENMENYTLTAVCAFVSFVIAMVVSLYIRHVGKKTNSQMLKVSSMHWFVEGLLSLGMLGGFLIGMILTYQGHEKIASYVDPIMAIGLALFLVKLPIGSFINNMFELLDGVPAKDVQEKIKRIIESSKPQSSNVERIRFRKAGEKVFLDVCFEVHGGLTVKEAEVLISDFEKNISREFENCDCIISFKSKYM